MSSLRDFVDGVGSLRINVDPPQVHNKFKVQQDVVIRRNTNHSGLTKEVIVGRILSKGTDSAIVSINRAGGRTQKVNVRLRDLSPVTATFKSKSVQFQPYFRGRS